MGKKATATKKRRGESEATSNDRKLGKKSFYLPLDVYEKFREVTNGHVSDPVAGALVLWMSLEAEASLREQATHLAIRWPVDKAVDRVRELTMREITNSVVREYVETLPEADRLSLLQSAKREGEKLSRKGKGSRG